MEKQQGSAIFSAIVAAPFGAVGIRAEAGRLRELVYLPAHFAETDPLDPLSARAAAQLSAYFADPDYRFDLPLAPLGSAFQQRVWTAIAAIPRGQVRTYGQVAKHIGSAARAVGQACGGLGGFAQHGDQAGFHVGIKRWLLVHEGVAGY